LTKICDLDFVDSVKKAKMTPSVNFSRGPMKRNILIPQEKMNKKRGEK